MTALTFDEMRDYLHFHGGEAHARWCSHLSTCDGECTASVTYPTADGGQIVVTAVLKHEALWPTVTYSRPDGTPTRVDPRRVSADTWHAIHAQISAWGDIPDPSRRPTPPKEVA